MSTTANPALPGGPNSPLATEEKTEYVLGLIVDQNNLLSDNETERNAICNAIAGILGTYNCQVADYPVAITISGLALTVGGIGQKVFCQGRMCDYIPTSNFTVGAASSSADRIDGLFIKYNLLPSGGRTQTVLTGGGTDVNMNIPDYYESVTWSYVPGTPGMGVPATPAGFELFAQVLMAQSSTTPVATIEFPTVQGQLLTGDVVRSLNNLVGAVNIQGSATITVDSTSTPGVIKLSLAGGQVVSVNTLTGAVVIQSGVGVKVTTSGGVIMVQSVDSFSGVGGAVVTTTIAGDGISRSIQISAPTINGLNGGVEIVQGPGVSVSQSGEDITIAADLEAGTNITIVPDGNALRISAASTPASNMPKTAYGTTSGRTGTASITLPNNSVTYELFIDWNVETNEDTPTISAPGSGVTGYTSTPGDNGATGATNAMHYAKAACNAVGTGAALSFALNSSGGASTAGGFWTIMAFPQS